MADPLFEPGYPGENAVEVARVIDRGLRESRAVDTESLCVVAGKLVWSLRIDIHILDNSGNLIDAANIAALAALLTFRRPECNSGEGDQDVIIHPPEDKEPLHLIIHHLPIAVTFAVFCNGNTVVVDPTLEEEAIMEGRMTITMNAHGDVCAIQKGGGEGVTRSVIMQCMKIASDKASDLTVKIKTAVENYHNEWSQSKVQRHSFLIPQQAIDVKFGGQQAQSYKKEEKKKNLDIEPCLSDQNSDVGETNLSQKSGGVASKKRAKKFIGNPLRWDPYSTEPSQYLFTISSEFAVPILRETEPPRKQTSDEEKMEQKPNLDHNLDLKEVSYAFEDISLEKKANVKSLKDAVKPKNRRINFSKN